MNHAPYGHLAGAANNRCCIMASHLHIAGDHGSLQPEQLLNLAKPYGEVEGAYLWADARLLGRFTFLQQWERAGFVVQSAIKDKKRNEYRFAHRMRIHANQFLRQVISGNRTLILVVRDELNPDLVECINEMQTAGVQVVLFALKASSGKLSLLVDDVVQVRTALNEQKASKPSASQDMRQLPSTGDVPTASNALDTLERSDPESYAMLYNLLGVTSDTASHPRVLATLRTRIRTTPARIPSIVLATLAILQSRPVDRSHDTLVPRNRLREMLLRYDIPMPFGISAIKLLCEEGSLINLESSALRARYNRPPTDPVHELSRTLWHDFVQQRPIEITDRILAGLEIMVFDPTGIDELIRDDLQHFIRLQSQEATGEIQALYRGWGLDDAGIRRFERRVREVLQDKPTIVDPSSEDASESGPKVAACLPRAANDKEPEPVPAGLRQAS
ncbi:MAG: hypothetical protein ABIO72_04255 [Patescibacteria group bacterium]